MSTPALTPELAAILRALAPLAGALATQPDAVFTGALPPSAPVGWDPTPLPLLREQRGLFTGSALDLLFLREDGTPLNGIPEGCVTVIAGPPGSGKTRTAMHALARMALHDNACALVLAEEAWRNPESSGREDLCSRFTRSAMAELGMGEDEVRSEILPNIRILETLHHVGQDWPQFIARFRQLVERDGVVFVVVDSLTAIDAGRGAPARHLAQLRTYCHERGVTCVVVSHIRDNGAPTGGEPLVHQSDATVLIERRAIQSKDEAARWNVPYKGTYDVASVLKSVTTRTYAGPLRVGRSRTGVLIRHPEQPAPE